MNSCFTEQQNNDFIWNRERHVKLWFKQIFYLNKLVYFVLARIELVVFIRKRINPDGTLLLGALVSQIKMETLNLVRRWQFLMPC